jgi:Conserved oligomeric complex COG6
MRPADPGCLVPNIPFFRTQSPDLRFTVTYFKVQPSVIQRTLISSEHVLAMTNDYFLVRRPSAIDDFERSPASPASPTASFSTSRSNLSSKVTSVLSASYADLEIRDALNLLDERGVESNAETRRQLRLDIQKDVIDSNGDIIREFGLVAEVRPFASPTLTRD